MSKRKILACAMIILIIGCTLSACGRSNRDNAISAVQALVNTVSKGNDLNKEDLNLKKQLDSIYGQRKYEISYFVNDQKISNAEYKFKYKDKFTAIVKPANEDQISEVAEIKAYDTQ